MNRKKELMGQWGLVLIASILGFFVSIAADATYDFIKGESSKNIQGAFFGSVLISYFLARLFTWLFENLDLKEEELAISKWLQHEWRNHRAHFLIFITVSFATLFLILRTNG